MNKEAKFLRREWKRQRRDKITEHGLKGWARLMRHIYSGDEHSPRMARIAATAEAWLDRKAA
jgi:hypothetical protein